MPASPYSSVQQARERIAARLVEVMKDAGIRTGRDLARRLGWQESKVSRIVNAVTPPSEDDVRAWCAACEVPEEVPGLIAALRMAEGAYVEWRRLERAGLRAAQEKVLPVYERTTRFRAYSPSLVSGLLQTREYCAAVLRAVQVRRGLSDDVEEAVQVRMDRQRILSDPAKTFSFVLEEQVLNSRVADDDVMAAQLGHLLTVLATHPNVSLRVVPSGARRQRWVTEGFWIYGTEQVTVELIGAYLTVTQPSEITLYEQAFSELGALAVTGTGVRKLIAAAVEALS